MSFVVIICSCGRHPKEIVNTIKEHRQTLPKNNKREENAPSSETCSTNPVILPVRIACSCSLLAASFSFATAAITRPSSVRISNPHTAACAGTGKTYCARGVADDEYCQNVCVRVTVADTEDDQIDTRGFG